MECPDCKHDNPPRAKFCSECGTRLPSACTQCGSQLASGAKFCSECGSRVTSSQPPLPAIRPGSSTALLPDLEGQFVAMRQAMPVVLQERLLAEADGENRLLTILFSDLTGSVKTTAQLAPEDAAALVNDVLKAMIDAVLEHDGRVGRLLGDGMLAFFGTPVAHESDPERAILAALRIRESVQKLGLNVTAGINTGEVYLGPVGNAGHHEITAMGTAINLAARLRESAQPGEIVVGETTHHHTQGAFAFARRRIEAKGFAEPVGAYLVEGRLDHAQKVRGVEGLRADLIGRDEELARLKQALSELRRGRGQLVSVIGEAGVGKSRLIADLRTIALADADRAPRWLEGRCLDIGMAVSYWPFLDLLRSCFGWTGEDDEAAHGRRLVATLQDLVREGSLTEARCQELVPLMADLVSADLGDAWAVVRYASAEQARQRTMLAIRDLILALARGHGLVLVLDDLHWADASSLDMISLLMESLTLVPLLLVCVARPDSEHRSRHLSTIGARKCPDRYTEIRLRELTPSQSRQLIASLLRIEDLPRVLSQLILDKAQGNPFFVEEVVRALIDAGAVYYDADGWRVRPELGEILVPESIQEVILSRVDRLHAEAKRVLQSASVIGRVFRRRLLARVTDQEVDLDQALGELEEQALIYEGRVTPEPEYSFQHQLTQETVYHNLLRRQRQAFHRQVAEAIESLYADGLDELHEQLAYHYDRAGSTAKAVEYLLKAGQKATERYANEEAIHHLDRALALATGAPTEEAIRLRRGGAHLDLFHGREAEGDFQWLLDRAHEHDDRAAELEALIGLSRAYYVRGLDDQSRTFMRRCRETSERALALAKELDDRPRTVRILLTTIYFADLWPNLYEPSAASAREALRLAREIGDDGLILEARLGVTKYMPLIEAVADAEALAPELEARGNLVALNMLHFYQMLHYATWGDFERGIAACERGIEVAAQLGVPPVQYATIKACCQTMLGRYDEAWQSLQAEVTDAAHPFGRAFQALGQGIYLIHLAAYERAADILEQVATWAVQLNRSWMQKEAESGLALATLRTGTLDPDLGRRVLATPDVHWWPLLTITATAEILLAQGDVEEALHRLDGLAAQAEQMNLRPRQAMLAEVRSRVLMRAGRATESLAATDAALPLAEAMGYRPIVWRLFAARMTALAALGRHEEAAAERSKAAMTVHELAAAIGDKTLRDAFLSDPEVAAVVSG